MKVTMPGRNPDFVGFGVHRSGSTWLHAQLRFHPGLWTPPPIFKEIHYFDELHLPQHRAWHRTRMPVLAKMLTRSARDATTEPELRRSRRLAELATSDRDDDWYRAVFGICSDPERVVGEITPAYSLMDREGIEHLRRLNPQVRIFLVLRDPAERVWSHLKLGLKRARPNGPESEADYAAALRDHDALRKAAGAQAVIARTEYRRMIESLESVFPAEQLYVSFYDRVTEGPAAMLADLATHLGVDPNGFDIEPDRLEQRHHSSPPGDLPPWLRSWALERFGDDLEWLATRYDTYPQRWLDINSRAGS